MRPTPNSSDRSVLSGRRVLIVEDEPLLAFEYSDELEDAGARPHIALSIAEADALIAEGLPDVAVLDVNIGADTVWPVASLLTSHGVPYVIVTGYSFSTNVPVGVVPAMCLEKPVGAHAVVDQLAALLSP
jgi:DNA-binding response OmpR family regulator